MKRWVDSLMVENEQEQNLKSNKRIKFEVVVKEKVFQNFRFDLLPPEILFMIITNLNSKELFTFMTTCSYLCKSFFHVDYIKNYMYYNLIKLGLHNKVANIITDEMEQEVNQDNNELLKSLPHFPDMRKCTTLLSNLDKFIVKERTLLFLRNTNLFYAASRGMVDVIDYVVDKKKNHGKYFDYFLKYRNLEIRFCFEQYKISFEEKLLHYCISKGNSLVVEHVYRKYVMKTDHKILYALDIAIVESKYENYKTLEKYYDCTKEEVFFHLENCFEFGSRNIKENIQFARYLIEKYHLERDDFSTCNFLATAMEYEDFELFEFLVTEFGHTKKDFEMEEVDYGDGDDEEEEGADPTGLRTGILGTVINHKNLHYIKLAFDVCDLTKNEIKLLAQELMGDAAFSKNMDVIDYVSDRIGIKNGVHPDFCINYGLVIIHSIRCGPFEIEYVDKLMEKFGITDIVSVDEDVIGQLMNMAYVRNKENIMYLIEKFNGLKSNRSLLIKLISNLYGDDTRAVEILDFLFIKLEKLGDFSSAEIVEFIKNCCVDGSITFVGRIIKKINIITIASLKISDWAMEAFNNHNEGIILLVLFRKYSEVNTLSCCEISNDDENKRIEKMISSDFIALIKYRIEHYDILNKINLNNLIDEFKIDRNIYDHVLDQVKKEFPSMKIHHCLPSIWLSTIPHTYI